MKRILFILFSVIPLLVLAGEHYKGIIYFGPEAMFFVECGNTERWWLEGRSFKAKGWSDVKEVLNSQPKCSLETMPCKMQEVPVSGFGVLSSRGEYGHLGMYPREIIFTEVTPITKADVKGCGL